MPVYFVERGVADAEFFQVRDCIFQIFGRRAEIAFRGRQVGGDNVGRKAAGIALVIAVDGEGEAAGATGFSMYGDPSRDVAIERHFARPQD